MAKTYAVICWLGWCKKTAAAVMLHIQNMRLICRLRIGFNELLSQAAIRVPGTPKSSSINIAIPFSRDVNPSCSVMYVMAIVEKVVVAAWVKAADTRNHLIAE
jgi:hypothetical protein